MMNATYCLPSFILKKSAKNATRVSHDATQGPRNLSYLALTAKTVIQIATPVFLKIAISSTGDMLAGRPATSGVGEQRNVYGTRSITAPLLPNGGLI